MRTHRSASADALSTAHLEDGLGERTAQGAVLAMSGQAVRMGLNIATSAVLARLLAPGDFGLVAMAAAVTSFANLFVDLGLSAATLQRKDIDQNTVSALFFMNIGAGLAVTLLAVAVAPLAARCFGDDRVLPAVIGLALPIFLGAASVQHRALLQRGMRWLALQRVDIMAQVAGAGLGVILAWTTDLGYWVLIAQIWMWSAVGLVLSWRESGWLPSRVTNWSDARSALGIGLNLTGFNFLNYFHRQLDNVLIGWRYGPSELGYYTRAYGLFLMPLTALASPLMATLLPALTRAFPEPKRWMRVYLSFIAPLVCLTAPLAGLLFVLSEPLVLFLFGPDWGPTVPIFRALAISILVQPIYSSGGLLYISSGRTAEKFKAGILATLWYLCLYAMGLPYGAVGVALAYSCGFLLLVPLWLWWATRGTSLSLPLIISAVWPPIVSTIASVGCCFAMGIHFPKTMPEAVVTGASLLFLYVSITFLIFLLYPAWRGLLRPAVQLTGEALASAFGKRHLA